jgi:hypothetical protein
VTEYFEARRSRKGGYGAFAVKDIEKHTVIMAEKPLFRANFFEVFLEYEQLTPEQKKEYLSLHGWKGIDKHKILSIFKTHRSVY